MEKASDEDASPNTNPNSDPTSYEEIREITLSIPVAADVECWMLLKRDYDKKHIS